MCAACAIIRLLRSRLRRADSVHAHHQINVVDTVYDSITSIMTNQYSITFSNPDPNTDGQLTVTVMDFSGNQGEETRGVAACP